MIDLNVAIHSNTNSPVLPGEVEFCTPLTQASVYPASKMGQVVFNAQQQCFSHCGILTLIYFLHKDFAADGLHLVCYF